jgi:hypothetical protein
MWKHNGCVLCYIRVLKCFPVLERERGFSKYKGLVGHNFCLNFNLGNAG